MLFSVVFCCTAFMITTTTSSLHKEDNVQYSPISRDIHERNQRDTSLILDQISNYNDNNDIDQKNPTVIIRSKLSKLPKKTVFSKNSYKNAYTLGSKATAAKPKKKPHHNKSSNSHGFYKVHKPKNIHDSKLKHHKNYKQKYTPNEDERYYDKHTYIKIPKDHFVGTKKIRPKEFDDNKSTSYYKYLYSDVKGKEREVDYDNAFHASNVPSRFDQSLFEQDDIPVKHFINHEVPESHWGGRETDTSEENVYYPPHHSFNYKLPINTFTDSEYRNYGLNVESEVSRGNKEDDHILVGGRYAEPPARYVHRFTPSSPMHVGSDDYHYLHSSKFYDPEVAASANTSPYVNYKNSNMAFSPQNLNDVFGL